MQFKRRLVLVTYEVLMVSLILIISFVFNHGSIDSLGFKVAAIIFFPLTYNPYRRLVQF